MCERIISLAVSAIFLLSLFSVTSLDFASSSETIVVPDDFSSVQEAINNAIEGDTIYVRNGTYYENVFVNKTVFLVGENRSNTIVDGGGGSFGICLASGGVSVSGFTIRNNGSRVVWVSNVNNCSLAENTLTDGSVGIHLLNADGSYIGSNEISGNDVAIVVESCEGNIIEDNNVTRNSEEGIKFYYSSGNEVNDNSVSHNGYGMRLMYSGNNKLRGNHIESNNYNFGVEAVVLSSFVNDVDTSNMVNGRQIHYLVNKENLTVDYNSQVGYLAVVNSEDILIKDLNLTDNGEGLLGVYCHRLTIENCHLINNVRGIYLYSLNNTTVKGNNVTGNSAEGVSLYKSQKCDFSDNVVAENRVGVFLYDLTGSTVFSNNVTNNFERGVQMLGSSYNTLGQNKLEENGREGIYMFNSNNNILDDNRATGNLHDGLWIDTSRNNTLTDNEVGSNDENGIYFLTSTNCQVLDNEVFGNKGTGISLTTSDNNTLAGNKVSGNLDYGVRLYRCSDNKIFNNNFLNHTYHASVFLSSYNSWDYGYPTGGNFWDDYSGEDQYSGQHQNLTGSDGIGDTPVVIGSNNTDRYPKMKQIRLHDITFVSATANPNEIYVGWTVNVSMTVENVGDYVESFDVTVYRDYDLIEVFSVFDLLIGKSVTLTFSWNTTGLTPCHSYVVRCEADIVPGEINFEDNFRVIDIVKIKMVGDVNGDGRINILDIAAIAIAYGSNVGDPKYWIICDLNRDGTINILDISFAAKSFGKSCIT